jgi:hypothetical protein
MLRMTVVTLTATLVVAAQTTYAQQTRPVFRPGLDNRGSAAEQKACRGDARRLCRSVLQDGDFAVLTCLRENRAKLSGSCREVLAKYGH